MRYLLLAIIGLSFLNSSKAQVQPFTQICQVTVDTSCTHNIVVWQRADQISTTPIDSIRIYRRTILGQDSLIATVDYDSLSEYHDMTANVDAKAWMYRIQGVDDNGQVGPMSLPHRTIHFKVMDNGSGNLHLMWTPYIGHAVDYYDCWRDSSGVTSFNLVNTTSTGTDTSWWDNSTPMSWQDLWYKVDVQWPVSCESTRANHNTTRSNRTQPAFDTTGLDINIQSLTEFAMFPNPVSGNVQLMFSSLTWDPIQIEILDYSGRIVYRHNPFKMLGQFNENIDLSHLTNGMYLVRIANSTKQISKQLIVNH